MTRRWVGLHNKEVVEPTINLTPLIDVVFVILIMFIVIAPLLELDRVELADAGSNPIDGPVAAQENSLISIHVHKDNSIWVNNQMVPKDQLVEKLRNAKRQYPNVRPQLFHDRQAHFGTYQVIKNAAETAGFQQLDIVLKPS
jgi:biopolymer transport protein ExbD